jgi:uncharacterized spore protein YtfJ
MPDVDELLRGAREAVAAGLVYAGPVERDGVTVIPAALVLGGGGGGGDSDNNGGGGFGVVVRPVGAYVIRGDEVQWQPAVDPARGWQLLAGSVVPSTWSLGRRMLRR